MTSRLPGAARVLGLPSAIGPIAGTAPTLTGTLRFVAGALVIAVVGR